MDYNKNAQRIIKAQPDFIKPFFDRFNRIGTKSLTESEEMGLLRMGTKPEIFLQFVPKRRKKVTKSRSD